MFLNISCRLLFALCVNALAQNAGLNQLQISPTVIPPWIFIKSSVNTSLQQILKEKSKIMGDSSKLKQYQDELFIFTDGLKQPVQLFSFLVMK